MSRFVKHPRDRRPSDGPSLVTGARAVGRQAVAVFVITTLLVATSAEIGWASEPDPLTEPLNGAAAVEALGDDLSVVAARHDMSADELAALFLADEDLWVDPRGDLLYQDTSLYLEDPEQAEQADSVPMSAEPVDESITFELESLPTATRIIYLDFDGYDARGTVWEDWGWSGADAIGFDLDGDPSTFNSDEHAAIHEVWARVSEDFAPFEVNVTTKLPSHDDLRRTSSKDEGYGTIAAISSTSNTFCKCGGVGYLGIFDSSTEYQWPPSWVFTRWSGRSAKNIAGVVSHEVGHNLGLHHDGYGGLEYYWGHNGWAPVMGVPYYQPISQWSRGEYPQASNAEDDFAVAVNHGAPLRIDDHGDYPGDDTGGALTDLNLIPDATRPPTTLGVDGIPVRGVIETADDVDVFEVSVESGQATFVVDTAHVGPNLDAQLTLHDGVSPMATSDPTSIYAGRREAWGMEALITAELEEGTYYLIVEGVGRGTPDDGYSDYGSLGHYSISAHVGQSPPVAVAVASPDSGMSALTTTLDGSGSNDPDAGDTLTYAWLPREGWSARSGATIEHTYLAGTWTAILKVTDQNGLWATDTVTITVDPSNLPGPIGAPDATVSGETVQLSWDAADYATSYTVEREYLHKNGSWRNLTTVGSTTLTSMEDTPGGGTFRYRVVAWNKVGTRTSDWTEVTVASTKGRRK